MRRLRSVAIVAVLGIATLVLWSSIYTVSEVEQAIITQFGEPVGVGPWQGDWPDDDRYDPTLLREGDRRNVVDSYRYWRRDAVVRDLDERRHDFHVAIENFQHDHNIGTVVRTANAFAARAVHIVGRRRWNRRGAMVTDRYQHLEHHPDVESLLKYAAAEDLAIVAVDNMAYTAEKLRAAVKAAKGAGKPVSLIVNTNGQFRTVSIDYHGGLRYPHLERTSTGEAGLDRLIAAK